jgi:uncharacterized membrane protein
VTRGALLFVTAFLASGVEMVEALTIVLAVGVTRGWRSTLLGAGAAVIALALLIAALGGAVSRAPIDVLRLAVGALLLIFGLQWLRKAILRAGGQLPLHDEEAAFLVERADAAGAVGARNALLDWYSFTVSFKGVFLEGVEVAFIVITFGAARSHGVAIAASAAAAALLIVLVAGASARAPLSRVPENTLKFTVGLLLASFGTFWSGEGAGVSWPGADGALLGILALLLLASLAAVRVLRHGFGPLGRSPASKGADA